jgi:hypothetical protein
LLKEDYPPYIQIVKIVFFLWYYCPNVVVVIHFPKGWCGSCHLKNVYGFLFV